MDKQRNVAAACVAGMGLTTKALQVPLAYKFVCALMLSQLGNGVVEIRAKMAGMPSGIPDFLGGHPFDPEVARGMLEQLSRQLSAALTAELSQQASSSGDSRAGGR